MSYYKGIYFRISPNQLNIHDTFHIIAIIVISVIVH